MHSSVSISFSFYRQRFFRKSASATVCTFITPGGGFGTSNMTGKYPNLIHGNIFTKLARSFQYYDGLTLRIGTPGNVIVLFPLGLLFTLLFTDSIKINFLVGAGFSLGIELFQLFLARATDIDDLWMNVLGMLLGYLAGQLILSIRKKSKL